jgi:uncharacterized protein
MYDYILIALASCLGSILTFFSGFGLGTILLPVFAIFFPLAEAVMLTAIVHLLNNLFKGFLIYKHIRRDVVIKFGILAILFALLGAYCLERLQSGFTFYSFQDRPISLVSFVIAIVILFFALFEIIPFFQKLVFSPSMIYLGGAITGFFGGLSGHQGALRSAFFLRLGLSKEQLIGTGTAIAILIDVSRLSVYFNNTANFSIATSQNYLWVAIASAFMGSWIGNYFLKKITIPLVQRIIAICLVMYSLALMLGYIQSR